MDVYGNHRVISMDTHRGTVRVLTEDLTTNRREMRVIPFSELRYYREV